MSVDAETGSLDAAHADRSAGARQVRRQRVQLFGSAGLVFAAVAVMLAGGGRTYPDGFLSAVAFQFGMWALAAVIVLLAAAWLAAFRPPGPRPSAGLPEALLGAGIACLTSPLFALPFALLSADAGVAATGAHTVLMWLWAAGIVLTGSGLVLMIARRR